MNRVVSGLGLVIVLAVLSRGALAATPPDPCVDTVSWRTAVCTFARTQLKHFAWGYEHGLRDYALATQIAANASIKYDDDVLFAASMLHDMGGFSPYAKPGVDHAVRSTEVISPVLKDSGFPMDKLEAVKSAIRTHSYYDVTKPATTEGILLHDADGLDFVGLVSVMRILSIAGHEPSIPNVKTSLKLLESLYNDATKRLYSGEYAQGLASARALEMRHFLDTLKTEAFSFGVP